MSEPTPRSEFGRDSLAELFAGSSNFIDRMPVLRVALSRAAEVCTADLADISEQPPQVALKRLGAGTAAELLGGTGGHRAVAVLHAPRWNARMVAIADRASVFAMIESMLGGDGTQPPYTPDRPLTRVELSVAKAFFARLGRALESAFAEVAPTSFLVEEVADEIDFAVLGGPHNAVAAGSFQLEALGGSGTILIAITRAALNPLRQVLARVPEKEAPAVDMHWSQHIRTELARTQVMVTAVLDERLSVLGEVASFKPGQVFELNATAHSRVRIECNGERLMWCHVGKAQGRYTLRVDELIDREQEFMDDILAG
jgi:flagellar motor switch protein FliM